MLTFFLEREVNEIADVEVDEDSRDEHTTLLSLLDQLDQQKVHRIPLSMEMEAAIQLLTLLWTSNASLQLYSKILKWVIEFIPGAKNQKIPSRDCVLKCLSNRYNLDC